MEISRDQNTIKLDNFIVNFNQTKGRKTCVECYFRTLPATECIKLDIPCRRYERRDKRNGIF
jgi:hypothetical protein